VLNDHVEWWHAELRWLADGQTISEKYALPGGTLGAAKMPVNDKYFLVVERLM
jgi:hypothetical protein